MDHGRRCRGRRVWDRGRLRGSGGTWLALGDGGAGVSRKPSLRAVDHRQLRSGRGIGDSRDVRCVPYPTRVSFLVELLTPFFLFSPRSKPHPSPPRSPTFLEFDLPGAYAHGQAVFFYQIFGGPVVFPPARRPGAGLQGIVLDLRQAGRATPQDHRPGGNWYVLPLYLSYSFFSI